MRKIIIDTDPGIDDTMALYVALNSPELDVIGLTTVYGNTSNIQGTENALRILQKAEMSHIQVHTGASKPLATKYIGMGGVVHGVDGQGNSNLETPDTVASKITAVEFMKNKINEFPGEITLVPIGPLTNIAELFLKYPDIDQKINEIVLMGGNALSQGNASPSAEANIKNDPESANIIFTSKTKITMVGLDVTNEVFMNASDIDEIWDDDIIEKRGWDVMMDGRVNLSPSYSVLGNVVEGVTNIPLARMTEEVARLSEMLDSRNTSMQRIALGLGWRTWDVNADNEEHDLIKIETKQSKEKQRKQKIIDDRAEKKKLAEEARFEGMSDEEIVLTKRKDEIFKTTSKEQKTLLLDLGLTKSQVKSLKYEKDRVNKIIELLNKEKNK